MIVYVVMRGPKYLGDDMTWNDGVFSTSDLAKERKRKLEAEETDKNIKFDIDEFELQ